MSGLIQFPHDLQKTLEVVHWFHLHPEECKEAMEVFLRLEDVPYRLVGKTSQVYSNITRICLAEHQYKEGPNQLRMGATTDFETAVMNLYERRTAFQTCAYGSAPYLFDAYVWSLVRIK